MIALIGNRPALQVGHFQIHDYDTRWLDDALRRAAAAADVPDFPFLEEIRHGVEDYLENKCSLELLPLPALFDRMRRMLHQIGCPRIADMLEPVAPPIPFSLVETARQAGNGFELAFFDLLRRELDGLRNEGAEEIRFTDLNDAVRLLCQTKAWNPRCDRLLGEIRSFLGRHDRAAHPALVHPDPG